MIVVFVLALSGALVQADTFSNVQAFSCAKKTVTINDQNVTRITSCSTNTAEQVTCYMEQQNNPVDNDPNPLYHGYPMAVSGSITLVETIQPKEVKPYNKTEKDPNYEDPLNFEVVGCWSGVRQNILEDNTNVAVRIAKDPNSNNLRSLLLDSGNSINSKLPVVQDKNNANWPGKDYVCDQVDYLTPGILDVNTNINYVYRVQFRRCACNQPNCNRAPIPDPVSAYLAPLTCSQWKTDNPNRPSAVAKIAPGNFGNLYPSVVISNSQVVTCAQNVTQCVSMQATITNRQNAQPYTNYVTVGGCMDAQMKLNLRELGGGEIVEGDLNNGDNIVAGGDDVAMVLNICSSSYCNTVPSDAPPSPKPAPEPKNAGSSNSAILSVLTLACAFLYSSRV